MKRITRKNNAPLIYVAKTLIPGSEIFAGLTGFYVGVPDRKYKGHTFKIKYVYSKVDESGEIRYYVVERIIKDWQKDAEQFRRFPDQWGNGTYTLAYYKVLEAL